MFKKFTLPFSTLLLLIFLFSSPILAQDKAKKDEKKDGQKEENLQLKKQIGVLKDQIGLLKKQNSMLKRRINTYNLLLRHYRKRLAETSQPLQILKKRALALVQQLQQAFRHKGIKGVIEVFQRLLKGRGPNSRRVSPPKIFRIPRPGLKKSAATKKGDWKNWTTSMKQARQMAAVQQKPMLVKIGAPW